MGRAVDSSSIGRRRAKWITALLACMVVVSIMVAGRLAMRKFAWWEQTSFDGRVAGKEARTRDGGELVADEAAIRTPAEHQFFLHIAGEDGTRTHEVTVGMYERVAPGDRAIKEAGRLQGRRVPASEVRPASRRAPAAGP